MIVRLGPWLTSKLAMWVIMCLLLLIYCDPVRGVGGISITQWLLTEIGDSLLTVADLYSLTYANTRSRVALSLPVELISCSNPNFWQICETWLSSKSPCITSSPVGHFMRHTHVLSWENKAWVTNSAPKLLCQLPYFSYSYASPRGKQKISFSWVFYPYCYRIHSICC